MAREWNIDADHLPAEVKKLKRRAIAQAVLATASFFVFGLGQSSAATLTVVTGAFVGGFSSPTGCNFKLDGDIQPCEDAMT